MRSAAYDPQYQYGIEIPASGTREEYEAACAALDVQPDSDEALTDRSYALLHAEYDAAQWRSKSRESRVLHILGGARMRWLQEQKPAATQHEPEDIYDPRAHEEI